MIKVLIVDDSLVFRKILADALARHPKIRVIGTAENGREALGMIRKLRPHIVVMDVEMPVMDGLQALDEIKRLRLNTGVIMFSSLTVKGAETTLDALAKGAFDFVPKPTGSGAFSESVTRIKKELIPLIEAHASSVTPVVSRKTRPVAKPRVNIRNRMPPGHPVGQGAVQHSAPKPTGCRTAQQSSCQTQPATKQPQRPRPARKPGKVDAFAIGVSTGGPNALNEVIPLLPGNFRNPVFLVQHMPPVFTTQLAARLNSKSKVKVVEARDGDVVMGGTVYLAPGDFHMEVHSDKASKVIRLTKAPKENSCRPAADVLFRSAARCYGAKCGAVIMTGMGKDGFEGVKVMKKHGTPVIAQDEASCVVYGMPKFVIEAGLADYVCPLDKIALTMQELAGF
jgi:two-component system chemotaxis response regulator CheB